MNRLEPFSIDFNGINLIEASAGTGKTYNITSLFIRALLELDVTVADILVVTYTEAATKELKDRLLERIGEAIEVLRSENEGHDDFLCQLVNNVSDKKEAVHRLETAMRSFDEAAVYTIHGFCYQSLQEQAFESGVMYDADMVGNDTELIQEAVDDYWRNWVEESSNDKGKRILLKFLLDKKYTPDSLTDKLASYLGQPYLKVLPEEIPSGEEFVAQAKLLDELYHQMKANWEGQQQNILSLFKSEQLNGNRYRKALLPGWIQQMHEFLSMEVCSIDVFDKFEKFTHSYLEESLKKNYTEVPKHPLFTVADRYFDIAKQLKRFEAYFKKNLLEHLQRSMNQKKEEKQVLSYDDLLLRLKQALYNGEQGDHLAFKIREKYPLALVDEFQDTDPNQYAIFRKVYAEEENCALFMIGDPKQSIYSFRGADVFSYLKAKKDASSDKMFNLRRNFRSVPSLIQGINRLFEENDSPFILDEISFQPVKHGKKEDEYKHYEEKGEHYPPIRFRMLNGKEHQSTKKDDTLDYAAQDTAIEIERLINGGVHGEITIGTEAVKAKDIAVLVRTHKQADKISKALQGRQIKSVQYSEDSVFDSEEAQYLQIFLRAVAEPADEFLVKSALALPLMKYTAAELLEIEMDDQYWLDLLTRFAEWHDLWEEKGFATMFYSALNSEQMQKQLVQLPDGERRVTNLLHLGELLQKESQKQKRGPRSLIKWLTRKRQEKTKLQEEEQLRLESDEDLVKVVTMHRSKGLQYPIVFCPFLWKGPELKKNAKPMVFHNPDDMNTTYLDLNGKDDPNRDRKCWLAAREDLSESMRLAYVAMTRAENCCYLTWTYANKSEYSPLGYLLMGPQKILPLMRKTISDKTQCLPPETIEERISGLCEAHPQLFKVDRPHEVSLSGNDAKSVSSSSQLIQRHFERNNLDPSYQISSFSSLTRWEDDYPHQPDYDQFAVEATEPEPTVKNKLSMFEFPRGPQPGTCIHNIFEEMDFQKPEDVDSLINEQLERYGIGDEWQPTVKQMLTTVIEKPLLEDQPEISLSNLSNKDYMPEIEFYFRSDEVDTQQILSMIRTEDDLVRQGRAEKGFLKGYIDLTFKINNKYYLLDYKSNYLGDSFEDYRKKALAEEMQESFYDLQYHIYSVALHRFLKQQIPDYTYETHFGGAFYLFVRGIRPDGEEGVFYDRPSVDTIKELDNYLER